MRLPAAFEQRMSAQLGGEYAAFLRALSAPPVRGLRVNAQRISAEEFKKISPWELRPTEILEEGFVLPNGVRSIGSHPFHAAGLFYMQEPSAMSAVAEAKKYIHQDMRILDMCAAPGGKSGGVAACMEGGLIVCNEVTPNRAKTLQFTLERLGVMNAAVISARPDAVAAALPEYFDMVLVDAPCSGEGMFRKDETAIGEWSPEHVSSCALRQRAILKSAYECLAQNGVLIYSTCTFSREENEDNVDFMLKEYPDMELASMLRLYPHTSCGEGHFAAVMRKTAGGRREFPDMRLAACREDVCHEFITNSVELMPQGEIVELPDGRVMLMPTALPTPLKALKLLTAGIYLGDTVKSRFEPSHALVMATGVRMRSRVELDMRDVRLNKYLSGETIHSDISGGWCSVCVGTYPVGLGKAVEGTVKNHIPKGLRINLFAGNDLV